MKYDFDHAPDRSASDSLKWRQYDADVVPLWVADMDFASPEPVVRALHERIEHGVFGYPVGISKRHTDVPEIRPVIVNRLRQLYDWEIEPGDLVFLPGVVKGFTQACHAVGEPGGGVLVQPPVYHHFLTAPQLADKFRQDVQLHRHPDGDYIIEWDAFEAGITDQTDLFILCNPHNPVGRVFRQSELERMAEVCLRNNVVICSDEIHCDLLFQGHQHTPIASLDPDIAANTITLMAPSKTFNLAGLQFSFAVIQNQELRRQYILAGKGLVSWVNAFGWIAAMSAYCEGQGWLDQLLDYLQVNRDYLHEFVRQDLPGVSMTGPEGTYLAWLDCQEAEIKGNPAEFFLQNARVALSDGSVFGSGGEGFVRLNFGCPRPLLAEALDRIKRSLVEKN
ncbi:MAG: PatB family C-S lyase [Anaerolineales bacterium]|jgi:cystathionine beta-lyase